MLTWVQIIISAVGLYFLFKIWGSLKGINDNTFLISTDTRKKEELNDALDKFAALYIANKKQKVVSFKTKIPLPPDEDE